jgi:serine/threonine-protein kinase
VAAHGPPAVETAIDYVRSILSALRAAHELGIVHRDIKPQNLFLHRPVGGMVELKVLDFGVARVLPRAPSVAPSPLALPTESGMVLGTPRFVSPEAALCRPVDTRADLYSVGLVLYLLLAGRGPFEHRRALGNLLAAHAAEVPAAPSKYASQALPPGLDAVVLQALEKRPHARFQTAEQFDAALATVRPGLTRVESLGEATPREPAIEQLAPLATEAVPRRVAPRLAPRRSYATGQLVQRLLAGVALFAGACLFTAFLGASIATLLQRVVGGSPWP